MQRSVSTRRRAAAKARGSTGGRPRTDPEKLEHARILSFHSHKTAADVCRTVGIGRRTLFRYLEQIRKQADTTASQELKPYQYVTAPC